MSKRDKKGFAIAAAVGAVAGVITGILFAPKSGKETRKDIKDAASKASEKLQAEAKKLQAEATQLVKKLEAKAGKTAKKHVKDIKHTASNLSTVARAVKAGEASDKDLDKAVKHMRKSASTIKAYLKK